MVVELPSEIHFVLPYSNFTVNQKNFCNSISTENATPGTTPVFAFNSTNTTLGLSATLAANGGLTQSLALTSSSTLINAGTVTPSASYDIPVKDQRDYGRTNDGFVDVGAFEYNGIVDNADVPAISYTALANTTSTSDRTVTATIADANGVYWFSQLTDLRPLIYYRKNSAAWVSSRGSLVSGTGQNGTWSFTINSANMGGVADGDIISYYIVSQDVSAQAAISSMPAGVVASNVLSVTTAPSPYSYVIGSATLPVKLESFETKLSSGGMADLSWFVSDEVNFLHYEIEKKVDGGNFYRIGTIPAAGLRTYFYTDRLLTKGLHYYRLKLVDKDGSFSYSRIEKVMISENSSMSLFPNPVANGHFTIKTSGVAQLKLFSNTGLLILQKTLVSGVNNIDVSYLAAGVYFIRVNDKEMKIVVQ